jgi:hypothetical protein
MATNSNIVNAVLASAGAVADGLSDTAEVGKAAENKVVTESKKGVKTLEEKFDSLVKTLAQHGIHFEG